MTKPVTEMDSPFLSDYDIFLFRQGRHYRLYRKLGSHPVVMTGPGVPGFPSGHPMPARLP